MISMYICMYNVCIVLCSSLFKVQQQDIPHWWHWLGEHTSEYLQETLRPGDILHRLLQEGTGACRYKYSTDHKQLNIYSRVLAKSSRVRVEYSRARVHCPRAEVLHSLVRTRELRVARVHANIASGSTIRIRICLACARSHSYGTRARARAHSYCTRECRIDLSRVERARVLSCLWSVL